MKNNRVVGIAAVLLIVAEMLTVVLSWLGSALYSDGSIVSLLSSEGVRWFVGSFASIVATPYVVYLILIGMAIGMVKASGVGDAIALILKTLREGKSFKSLAGNPDFHPIAMQISLFTLLLFIIIISLLTFLPHAVLINASGTIVSSSFSRGIIPILCFGVTTSSTVYGIFSSNINTVESFATAFTRGLSAITPLLLLYILTAQLYYSITYVLC